uniref:Uncharacterized protein n=1 Tax=Actinobacteria phage HS02 TaxID=3056388 RepID=A0AA49X237_9VIRU|nr:MAG: hypothetical protein [Actinobacteria phage HS02]
MWAPGGSSFLARRLSAVIAVMVESSVIIPAVVSASFEVSQVLFRLSRWENLEYAKKI